MLEVLCHKATFDGLRLCTIPGEQKCGIFVCLSVCLYVMLLNSKGFPVGISLQSFALRSGFDIVG